MQNTTCFNISLKTLPDISMANDVTIGPPYVHFRRVPTEYVLYIILDGNMPLTEDNTIYNLRKGDIILLDPSRCHYGRETSTCTYYYIHFLWEYLSENEIFFEDFLQTQINQRIDSSFSQQQKRSPEPLIIPKYCHMESTAFRRLTLIANDIKLSLHSATEFNHQLAACHLIRFFVELNQTLTDTLIHQNSTMIDQTILAIISYLRRNYNIHINSEMISTQFHCNFDYINRKFKIFTGKTIFQYLNEYRIEQSKAMLQSRYYSNSQIASATGFCNEFYFSRVFKKHTGMSPTTYLKNIIP